MINKLDASTFAPLSPEMSKGMKGSQKASSSNLSAEFGEKLENLENTENIVKDLENKIKKGVSEESKENLDAYTLDIANIPQMQMLQVPTQLLNQEPKVDLSALNLSDDKNLELLQAKVSEQTKPVLKFMQAMFENFGIQPEQIMEALNGLPPEMLIQSPQSAMTPFFEKLQLQPKQFTKAQILFTEMLTELEKNQPQQAELKYAPIPKAQLTKMPPEAQPNPAGTPQLAEGQLSEKPVLSARENRKPTLEALIEQKIQRKALEPQNIRSAIQQPQSPGNFAEVFNFKGTGTYVPSNDGTEIAIDKLKEMDPQLRIEDIKVNSTKLSDQFFVEKPTTLDQLQKMQFGQGGQMNMSQEELEENLKEGLAQIQPEAKGDVKQTFSLVKPEQAGSLETIKNENVKNILDQSQTLIQKGGGEMKIQLRPEGLGEVHLKVRVQDGQVGIQMTTETSEAKRLLETGLSELKLNLADHKLNLNHIKVDVSEQLSQNLNQNQDAQREQARDFLSQFRQYNDSARQSFSDLSAIRGYKKATSSGAPDIEPIESRSRNRSDAGRLHLVA